MEFVAYGLFFAALALAAAAWLIGPATVRAWRHRRVLRQPFPAAWRRMLRQHMPAYAALPPPLQQQVRQRTQLLIASVPFIGCAGLQITDDMRVLVAAQAALLQFMRPLLPFPGLRQVLLYPGAFVVGRSAAGPAGLVHESRTALAGESSSYGQVVLSWSDVLHGAADPADGRNVVLHEFAHQLDQASGAANGAPWLGGPGRAWRRQRQAQWARVMAAEYAQLQSLIANPSPDGKQVIDDYGATDPAEFFAVVTEHFFEQPAELSAAHPALYAELAAYYRCDPRLWV